MVPVLVDFLTSLFVFSKLHASLIPTLFRGGQLTPLPKCPKVFRCQDIDYLFFCVFFSMHEPKLKKKKKKKKRVAL